MPLEISRAAAAPQIEQTITLPIVVSTRFMPSRPIRDAQPDRADDRADQE